MCKLSSKKDNKKQAEMIKVYRYNKKTYISIKFEVIEEKHLEKEEIQARLTRIMPWIKSHLGMWADFDYSFSINLFCDALKALAHGLKRWGNCSNTTKNYKRCLYASEKLRKAYNSQSTDDKSWVMLCKNNPIYWVKYPSKIKGLTQMKHSYKINEEYYTKMFNLIHKRTEKAIKNNKKEAWEYINKYIEHWWD